MASGLSGFTKRSNFGKTTETFRSGSYNKRVVVAGQPEISQGNAEQLKNVVEQTKNPISEVKVEPSKDNNTQVVSYNQQQPINQTQSSSIELNEPNSVAPNEQVNNISSKDKLNVFYNQIVKGTTYGKLSEPINNVSNMRVKRDFVEVKSYFVNERPRSRRESIQPVGTQPDYSKGIFTPVNELKTYTPTQSVFGSNEAFSSVKESLLNPNPNENALTNIRTFAGNTQKYLVFSAGAGVYNFAKGNLYELPKSFIENPEETTLNVIFSPIKIATEPKKYIVDPFLENPISFGVEQALTFDIPVRTFKGVKNLYGEYRTARFNEKFVEPVYKKDPRLLDFSEDYFDLNTFKDVKKVTLKEERNGNINIKYDYPTNKKISPLGIEKSSLYSPKTFDKFDYEITKSAVLKEKIRSRTATELVNPDVIQIRTTEGKLYEVPSEHVKDIVENIGGVNVIGRKPKYAPAVEEIYKVTETSKITGDTFDLLPVEKIKINIQTGIKDNSIQTSLGDFVSASNIKVLKKGNKIKINTPRKNSRPLFMEIIPASSYIAGELIPQAYEGIIKPIGKSIKENIQNEYKTDTSGLNYNFKPEYIPRTIILERGDVEKEVEQSRKEMFTGKYISSPKNVVNNDFKLNYAIKNNNLINNKIINDLRITPISERGIISDSKIISDSRIKTDSLISNKSAVDIATQLDTKQLTQQQYKTEQTNETRKEDFFRPKDFNPRLEPPFKLFNNQPEKENRNLRFDVKIKRKGKLVTIGKNVELNKARKLFTGELANTLRASGTIVYAGTKNRAKLNIGQDYYTSSKTGLYTEKLGRRLKSSGEISEIQNSKKMFGVF